jgi:hypothetical protein
MADLRIAHHERLSTHPHRWRVHLHGRAHLPPEEQDVAMEAPVRLYQTHFAG